MPVVGDVYDPIVGRVNFTPRPHAAPYFTLHLLKLIPGDPVAIPSCFNVDFRSADTQALDFTVIENLAKKPTRAPRFGVRHAAFAGGLRQRDPHHVFREFLIFRVYRFRVPLQFPRRESFPLENIAHLLIRFLYAGRKLRGRPGGLGIMRFITARCSIAAALSSATSAFCAQTPATLSVKSFAT
jgi:hypothetical protein